MEIRDVLRIISALIGLYFTSIILIDYIKFKKATQRREWVKSRKSRNKWLRTFSRHKWYSIIVVTCGIIATFLVNDPN